MAKEPEAPELVATEPAPTTLADRMATMPPETAALLQATVDDLVQQQLQARLAEAVAPAPAPPAEDWHPRDPRWDQAAQQAAEQHPRFTCSLPQRFADYLRQRAAAHNETPEQHLATILRRYWQTDLWREQGPALAAQQPGMPARTSLRT